MGWECQLEVSDTAWKILNPWSYNLSNICLAALINFSHWNMMFPLALYSELIPN